MTDRKTGADIAQALGSGVTAPPDRSHLASVDASEHQGQIVPDKRAGPAAGVSDELRLRMRHPSVVGRRVDGGWWPRSLDLGVELPLLLGVMYSAGYDVYQVIYNVTTWDRAGRTLSGPGHDVQLSGWRSQDPALVSLVDGSGHKRLYLMVIPPPTEDIVAERCLELARVQGHLLSAAQILDRGARHTPAPTPPPGGADPLPSEMIMSNPLARQLWELHRVIPVAAPGPTPYPVHISAALAADLTVLTGALGESGQELQTLLCGLADAARRAVGSYLGLSITLTVEGHQVTLTAMDTPASPGAIASSALLPLPVRGDTAPADVIVFYAATAGAFVDFATDLRVTLGAAGDLLVIDDHPRLPGDTATIPTGLADMSLRNQAIGILIERGHTPEQADAELDCFARLADIPVHAAAQLVRANVRRPQTASA